MKILFLATAALAGLVTCSTSSHDGEKEMSKEAKREHVLRMSEDFCECHDGVRFASPDAIECEDGMKYEGNVLKIASVDCPDYERDYGRRYRERNLERFE